MNYELYLKPGFGRRIRQTASINGMRHILGNLWTSIAGYGHGAPAFSGPPQSLSPSSISGAAGATSVGTVFTATPATFEGADTVTGRWKDDMTPIAGQTGLTFDSTGQAAGVKLNYEAIATNKDGTINNPSNVIVLTPAP